MHWMHEAHFEHFLMISHASLHGTSLGPAKQKCQENLQSFREVLRQKHDVSQRQNRVP